MFTVALVGPDGAGKTTIARQLERHLSMPSVYVYMGVNLEASRAMLPTTRLMLALKRARGGRPDMVLANRGATRGARRTGLGRGLAAVKSGLRTANWLAEEWYRQLLAWRHLRRGRVVIFDRHFFADYYAHDVAGGPGAPLGRRVHGAILRRWYPRPELVVCLDAPPEVLLARKGEGTLEWLASRRAEYLALRDAVPHFVVVDATQPLDAVRAAVVSAIESNARTRSAGGTDGAPAAELRPAAEAASRVAPAADRPADAASPIALAAERTPAGGRG